MTKAVVGGEVQLIMAPVALDKMSREHKHGASAFLHTAHDVLDDRLSWHKVFLMVADSEPSCRAFKVGEEGVVHPVCVMLAVRHKSMKLNTHQIFRSKLSPSGTMFGSGPLPDHAHIPGNVQTMAQS